MRKTNPTTVASRRYVTELTTAMIVYVAVLFGTRIAFRHYAGPWQIAIDLAPAVPIVFVFIAAIKLYRDTDELVQRLVTESLSIAGAITAFASVTYGFMEGDVLPRPSPWWVWSLFMASWLFATLALRRRYR